MESIQESKERQNKFFVIECYVFVPIRKLVANLKLHAGFSFFFFGCGCACVCEYRDYSPL